MGKLPRRQVLRLAGLAATVPLVSKTAFAQTYPTRPVKLVVAFTPGGTTDLLARILSPADYGLVAMATVYIGLTTMITDFGLGSAIVALPGLSGELAAQLHAVATLVGIVAFGLSCLVAVPLSRFFGSPNLAPVVIVLSTALVLDSLRVVPTSISDLMASFLSIFVSAYLSSRL